MRSTADIELELERASSQASDGATQVFDTNEAVEVMRGRWISRCWRGTLRLQLELESLPLKFHADKDDPHHYQCEAI